MTRTFLAALVAVSLFAASARAHDAYDDSQANPLRIAAYLIHPAGWAVEWLFTRPLHFFVSQPATEPIFGHVPHESPFGGYEPYDNTSVPEN